MWFDFNGKCEPANFDILLGDVWTADFWGENLYSDIPTADLVMGIFDWLTFLFKFLKISFILKIYWLFNSTWFFSSIITYTALLTTFSKLTCSPWLSSSPKFYTTNEAKFFSICIYFYLSLLADNNSGIIFFIVIELCPRCYSYIQTGHISWFLVFIHSSYKQIVLTI